MTATRLIATPRLDTPQYRQRADFLVQDLGRVESSHSFLIAELEAFGAPARLIAQVVDLIAIAEDKLRQLTSHRARQRKYAKKIKDRLTSATSADVRNRPSLKKESSFSEESSLSPSLGRGARLPADWQPSQADIEFARGLIGEAWHIEADKFRDYWHAKAGADARKVSWSLTWRNWVRRAAESRPNGKANGAQQLPLWNPGERTQRAVAETLARRGR